MQKLHSFSHRLRDAEALLFWGISNMMQIYPLVNPSFYGKKLLNLCKYVEVDVTLGRRSWWHFWEGLCDAFAAIWWHVALSHFVILLAPAGSAGANFFWIVVEVLLLFQFQSIIRLVSSHVCIQYADMWRYMRIYLYIYIYKWYINIYYIIYIKIRMCVCN